MILKTDLHEVHKDFHVEKNYPVFTDKLETTENAVPMPALSVALQGNSLNAYAEEEAC